LPEYTAQVGGTDFTIRADCDLAQALRRNRVMGVRYSIVPGLLGGDAVTITARLDYP